MKRFPSLPRVCQMVFALALAVSPVAGAQTLPAKIFVASYGSDTNAGTSVSPKRNFQAAHSAVNAGGEIVVLDTAGYGALNITKSVAVTVPPGVNAFVTVSGSANAITVSAGAGTVVELHGLILEGGGSGGSGTGVYATSVGTLEMDDCVIRKFSEGIYLIATTSAHLVVRGGSARDVGFGILVAPAIANLAVDGFVSDFRVDNATQEGIQATGGGGTNSTTRLTARNCLVSHCVTGVTALGAGASIYMDGCNLSHNTTGVSNNEGVMATGGNNAFANNGTNGAFNANIVVQ